MSTPESNSLFSRFGVELEYMLVRRDSLEVAPVADQLLHSGGSQRKNERKWEGLRISNELVLHVLEFKTDGPAGRLEVLAELFQCGIQSVNTWLEGSGVCLLPGAMHPWMDPHAETKLWPHGDRAIYAAFDRIFDCRGHGWSNLQSTHLNLPFANEAEFVRLHRALRVVLPLVPALAASSPFLEGRTGGLLDHRLAAYRENCRRIPSITARVVPEDVSSIAEYRSEILGRIEADLKPHDPEGILEAEWVNARGTIARFERGTIEMRVMDVQECPAADLAILQFIVAILRELTSDERAERLAARPLTTEMLAAQFEASMEKGREAPLLDPAWAQSFGLDAVRYSTVGDLLGALEARDGSAVEERDVLQRILREGCLSERLLRAAGSSPDRGTLRGVYAELRDCLAHGTLFRA